MIADAIIAIRDLAWASAGLFLALISGAVAIYGGARFGLIPGLHGLVRTYHRWEAAAELIEAQLTPNHGTSLLDRVTRIDQRLSDGCPLFGDTGVCPLGQAVSEHLAKERLS